MLHLPEVSDWCLDSSSGVSVSFAPLAEGPTFSSGKLSIPLSHVDKNGTILETAVLDGYGSGVSFSLAAEIPVNFSVRTLNAPGGGTYIMTRPMAPDRVPASYFEGLCLIYTGDVIYGFMDKGSSVAIFLPAAAVVLPFPAILTMIKGAGLIEAFGFTSTAASVSTGVQGFYVSLRGQTPPLPYDQRYLQNSLVSLPH